MRLRRNGDNVLAAELGRQPATRLLFYSSMRLVWPGDRYLAGYVDALQRGWSPDNLRQSAAQEELAKIARDAHAFLAQKLIAREPARRSHFLTAR